MKTLILLLFLLPAITFGFCDVSQEPKAPELLLIQKSIEKRKEVWSLQARDINGDFHIKLTVYPARNTKGHNLILFPTIEGESLLERRTAMYFARRGYMVMIPTIEEVRVPFGPQTACAMDMTYRRVQASAMLIAQLLEQARPAKRLMLLGASQGGIRSIMAAAALPNAHAVWSIVAGGDFPSIYAYSRVLAIADFRQQHMAALNIDQTTEYEQYLRENLSLDPELSCSAIDANLALVVASEDVSVPTNNQERLVERCQPHRVTRIDAGHIRGAAELFLKRKTIRNFFESK